MIDIFSSDDNLNAYGSFGFIDISLNKDGTYRVFANNKKRYSGGDNGYGLLSSVPKDKDF